MFLSAITSKQEKVLITNDLLHKYIKHKKFWLVVDNKDKPKGLFNSFLEAYYKRHYCLLIASKDVELSKRQKAIVVNVTCFCGNKFKTRKNDINRGKTKSCGCLRKASYELKAQ